MSGMVKEKIMNEYAIVRITGGYHKPVTFQAQDWLEAIEQAKNHVQKFDAFNGHRFCMTDHPCPSNRALHFSM